MKIMDRISSADRDGRPGHAAPRLSASAIGLGNDHVICAGDHAAVQIVRNLPPTANRENELRRHFISVGGTTETMSVASRRSIISATTSRASTPSGVVSRRSRARSTSTFVSTTGVDRPSRLLR
jgi:hypothetical protein